MAKEKDISEKTLEDCNDVFADIVNNVIFGGRKVVQPEALTNATVTSQMKLDGKLHEQERDVAKYWNDRKIRLCLLGLENMTQMEHDMVLRVFSYDGASYREQVNDRISARRVGQKPRPVYPAITVVLYFGQNHWTAPRSLRECMQVELPPELTALVPDYQLHIVELAHMTPEQVEAFQSDFFLPVFYLNNPGSTPPADRVIRHVDETMKLMTAITGKPNYIDAGKDLLAREEGGDITMLDFLERAEARGREAAEKEFQTERKAYQAALSQKDRMIDELQRKLALYQGGN